LQASWNSSRTYYLLVNVLHQFELATSFVNFWNCSWLQFVQELAENDSVLESVLVGCVLREFLSENSFDPLLSLFLLSGVTLPGDLGSKARNNKA
jgi:hypothetical protein